MPSSVSTRRWRNLCVWILGIALLLLIIWLVWAAQRTTDPPMRTFVIRVKPKTAAHPWYGKGSQFAFTINGKEAATLHLKRGGIYRFLYRAAPSAHPFYLTSSDTGGDHAVGRVPGSPAPFLCDTTIQISDDYPHTLFYQSAAQPRMGGIIQIR